MEEEERGVVVNMFKSASLRVVTVVEEEADFCSSRNDFVKGFEECLMFYTLYLEMLEESFPSISNEKLMLERECSRSIVSALGCNSDEFGDDCNYCERRERGIQWCIRLREAFNPFGFSDDVVDDVRVLLKRYRSGWSLMPQGDEHHSGIYLNWKDEPEVWASTWKP